MDEILEVADAVVDTELEDVVVWLLRIVGLLAIVAGLALWLFTDMGLLFLPAVLIVLGLVLLIIPGILLALAELAG